MDHRHVAPARLARRRERRRQFKARKAQQGRARKLELETRVLELEGRLAETRKPEHPRQPIPTPPSSPRRAEGAPAPPGREDEECLVLQEVDLLLEEIASIPSPISPIHQTPPRPTGAGREKENVPSRRALFSPANARGTRISLEINDCCSRKPTRPSRPVTGTREPGKPILGTPEKPRRRPGARFRI